MRPCFRTFPLALALAACASAPGPFAYTPHVGADVVTAADLTQSSAIDAYGAMQSVRPLMLKDRDGNEVAVYVDGIKTAPHALAAIRTSDVLDITLVSKSRSRSGAAELQVRTRRP